MATIGDTGAPSTNTIYYDALLSTTLDAMRKQMIDNIFKKAAFLAYLREFSGLGHQDGGERETEDRRRTGDTTTRHQMTPLRWLQPTALTMPRTGRNRPEARAGRARYTPRRCH